MKRIPRIYVQLLASVALGLCWRSAEALQTTISRQGTDIVLSWPSLPGEKFTVQSRDTLNPGSAWVTLADGLPAAIGSDRTTFIHTGVLPDDGGGGQQLQAESAGSTTRKRLSAEETQAIIAARRAEDEKVIAYLMAQLEAALARGRALRALIEKNPALLLTATQQAPPTPLTAEASSGCCGFYRVFKTSPTANPDFFGVQQDSGPNQLGIFDNDFDPDDDIFLLANVTPASHGTIQYTDNAFTFRYTPAPGFFGTDTVAYTVTNLTGGRATATVTVFISQTGNSRPTITAPSVTLATNTYAATVNPLTGASDLDGDTVSFVAVTTPRLGTVTNISGQLQYTHPSNYFGPDSFDYFLTDGRGALTRVHVMIEQADADGDGMADEWEMLLGLDPSVNDANADPDGDGLPNLAEYKLGTDPRIAGNPLALDKIAAGQAFSNYARVPLSLIAPIERFPITLLANGASASAFLQQGADGGWYFTWDTGQMLNGNYSLGVSFQFNSDAQPPTPRSVAGPTKTVRVTNEVIFDPLNSGFSSFWTVHLTFAYTPADWRIELYDEDGSGLVYFEGTDTDGELYGGWDLTDTGQGGRQISFGNIRAAVYAAPAGQGLPPVGQQAAAKAQRWFTKEVPGGIGDKFVVAWGWHRYLPSFNEKRENLMLDGVINILANPGLDDEYELLPQGLNGWHCCAFRYDTSQDQEVLLKALANPEAGNFFWFGHGDEEVIQGNAKKSSLATGNVENALQNKAHRSKPPKYSYQNKHPCRLVILNGCKTYSQGWANAFGITYSPGGSTNIVFEYTFTGREPQAFVGWTGDVDVPDLDPGGGEHPAYAQALAEMFARWMGNFPLDICLDFFGDTAVGFGFDDQDTWKISGCIDLQRHNP